MDEHERFEVRISDPGEVAAAVPHLLGFRPEESVVLIGLGGPSGGRVGLTVRADIPPSWHAVPLAGALARRVATDDPDSVVVVLVSEARDEVAAADAKVLAADAEVVAAGVTVAAADEEVAAAGEEDLPHRALLHALVVALDRQGIPVHDALLVRGGRWWSYDCAHPCCDPAAGTPLPAGVSELAVASVAGGQVLARDRAELVARLGPVSHEDLELVASAVQTVAAARAVRVQEAGWAAVEEEAWRTVLDAVARRRPGSSAATLLLPAEELARVLWGLQHPEVRDRALGLALGEDSAAAEALWTECTRRAPFPVAAPPATLLAACAWLRGDGAMANVALEHALLCDEDHQLARLLSTGLAACLHPEELRAMIAGTVRGLDGTTAAG